MIKTSRIPVVQAAVASAFLALLLVPTTSGSIALSQTPAVAGGDFDGCPVIGLGGDPALNSQKNRSAEPAQTKPITVAQMVQLPTVPASDGDMRSGWPATLRSTITGDERQAVVLTSYIVKAIPEGPESCNCESAAPKDHDVHVYVADDPDATAAQSAIVEVTPRWRAAYPSWNAQDLKQLAESGTEVRITGWLMYDQEHWDMIAKDERATLWDIHPVTGIQVQTSQGWVDLAEYSPTDAVTPSRSGGLRVRPR